MGDGAGPEVASRARERALPVLLSFAILTKSKEVVSDDTTLSGVSVMPPPACVASLLHPPAGLHYHKQYLMQQSQTLEDNTAALLEFGSA